jgi:ribosomal protein S1
MTQSLEQKWELLKIKYPICSKYFGKILSVHPYGIFIDSGFQALKSSLSKRYSS